MNQNLPEYITKDQFRILYGQAQQQGLKDPGQFAKVLVDQGHVLEGLNDQGYDPKLNMETPTPDQQPSGPVAGTANAVRGFGVGIVKGVGQVFNNITQPISNLLSKPFASKENIQANTQLNEQSYTPNGTSEKVGAAVGKTLPAVGAGLAGQAYLAGPLMAAGASPLVAGSVAQGAGAGAEAFLGTKGSLGQRAKSGAVQGVSQAVGNYALGKLLPILGLGGGEFGNKKAYDSAISTVKDLNGFQTAINQESKNVAEVLTETGATTPLDSETSNSLIEQAAKYKFKLPSSLTDTTARIAGDTFHLPAPPTELTPAESQNLLIQMGKAARKAGNPAELMDMIDQIQNGTIDSLNAHAQGLGDEFGNIYTEWRNKTDIVNTAFDIFQSDKPIASPTLEGDIQRLQKLTSTGTGKQVWANIAQNIKDIGGPDLTTSAKAIQAANQIKNPVLQKHATNFLKATGLVAAGAFGGPKVTKFLSKFGL